MKVRRFKILCLMLILSLMSGSASYAESAEPKNFENSDFVINQQMTFENDMKKIYQSAVQSSGLKHTHGMYVENLLTGERFSINGDKTRVDRVTGEVDAYFRSASVAKLPMSWALVKLIEDNKLSYTKVYRDSLTGRKFTIKAEIQNMLRRSNNNSYNTVLRLVNREGLMEDLREEFRTFGLEHINLYAEVGMPDSTNLKRYGTTKKGMVNPNEVGQILKDIYLKKNTHQMMKDVFNGLDGNIYNSRIPAGMPSNVIVAHKTGTDPNRGIYNDAAICCTPSGIPFVLVFFTESEKQGIAETFERTVSRNVLKYMETKGIKSAKLFKKERAKFLAENEKRLMDETALKKDADRK